MSFIEFITVWLLFMFWIFGPKACGSLAPWPGIESAAPASEGGILTPGPPGKYWLISVSCFLNWSKILPNCRVYTIMEIAGLQQQTSSGISRSPHSKGLFLAHLLFWGELRFSSQRLSSEQKSPTVGPLAVKSSEPLAPQDESVVKKANLVSGWLCFCSLPTGLTPVSWT